MQKTHASTGYNFLILQLQILFILYFDHLQYIYMQYIYTCISLGNFEK